MDETPETCPLCGRPASHPIDKAGVGLAIAMLVGCIGFIGVATSTSLWWLMPAFALGVLGATGLGRSLAGGPTER